LEQHYAESFDVLWSKLNDTEEVGLFTDDDLQDNLAFADDFAQTFRDNVDRFTGAGESVREPVKASSVSTAISPASICLVDRTITSVIWATGFRFDFSWIDFPVFDDFGYPIQQRGRSPVPGLHFLGMNYVDTRGSGILYGAGKDAEQLRHLIIADLHERLCVQ